MKIGTHHRWIYGALIVALGAGGTGPVLAGGGCCGGAEAAEETKETPKEAPPKAIYPLDTCPLSGKKLGSEGAPVIYDHKGRELRFPSKDCIQAFMKDPEGSLAKIDAAIIQQQLPTYPMTTCPVSDDKLGGEMGEPVNRVYQNRLVRFCCPSCLKEFEKDPVKILAKRDATVIAKEKLGYPLATCPVSGDKLGGEMGDPVDYVFANRLVRFCCPSCFKDFAKDPWKSMAKIDEVAKAKKGESKDKEKKHEHKH